ncbi:MAG TPA: antibiotic biosynthesis monooxygenase family protein [Streptomyces sp.]
MTGKVRVVLYLRVPETGPEAIHDAYHRISEELAGTPGMLGNELLGSVLSAEEFAVLSEWADLPAFQAWEQGPAHRGKTSPLRPYQDRDRGRHYGIYEVVAAY